LTVWEARPSSTFVSVFTCEFAENAKVMQTTPTPDRLPGMRGQPLREIMFDSPFICRMSVLPDYRMLSTVKTTRTQLPQFKTPRDVIKQALWL
jgi:hypothetical protein